MQYVNSTDLNQNYSVVSLEQLSNVNPNGREDESILVFNSETNSWEISNTLSSVLDGNNHLIRIKRTSNLSSIEDGELVYNPQNETLYCGTDNGILPVAGPGSFLTRDTDQIVSGVKTFNSHIYIKNPIQDLNPATKLYVDMAILGINSEMFLSNLADVNLNDLTDGSVLVYNSATSRWKANQTKLTLTDGGNF